MRLILKVAGVVAVVMGLLWIGQGMGAMDWLSSSFMNGDRTWAVRGALLAAGGAVLILFSSLPGRR